MCSQNSSDTRGKLLTIVIPVHNRAGIVRRTLRSLEKQDDIDKTIIYLVDNNSIDASYDVLRDWAIGMAPVNPDIMVLSERRPGACAARNCGLNHVTTLWTMFFDSDDEMNSGLISSLLAKIATEGENLDLIGWPIRMQQPDATYRQGVFSVRRILWNHLLHACLATQRYAARTQLFREVGCWNEQLRRWDDYELGIRLLMRKPRVAKLTTQEMVTTYFTDVSLTGRLGSSSREASEEALDACQSALDECNVSHGAVWIDVRRTILAAEYQREGHTDFAELLMKRTLDGKGVYRRAVLRLLYAKHKRYPRGTGRFAALFFRLPKVK